MRSWLHGRPYWFRIVVSLFLMVPLLLALPHALFGGNRDALGGLSGLGGLIGAIVAARIRDRDYWRLDPATRRAVRSAEATGEPTGVAPLDSIAARRLTRDRENEKVSRSFAPIFAVISVTVPVVAAFRSSWWWLTCAVPGVAVCGVWLATRHDDRLSSRLDRLITAINTNARDPV